MRNLLASLTQPFNRLLALFQDKTQAVIEEYVLEHLLVYHGLVGSTPQNNLEFKDVRADIISAVKNHQSNDLAIALKLPPLWWEEKLQSIFAELDTNDAITTLLPKLSESELLTTDDLLSSADWRVVANAAHLLAYLKAGQGVSRLNTALNACTQGDLRPAFCHVSLALGKLQTEDAFLALLPYLLSDDEWFRVDAARALSLFKSEAAVEQLMLAMLSHHQLSDYMAVTIAQQLSPLELLKSNRPLKKEGALELIIGILKASNGAFGNQVVLDTQVHQCLKEVLLLAKAEQSPRHIRAAISLKEWLCSNPSVNLKAENSPFTDSAGTEIDYQEIAEQVENEVAALTRDPLPQVLLEHLCLPQRPSSSQLSQAQYAIELVGELGIPSAVSKLSTLLSPNFVLLDEVIVALGNLRDKQAALPLIDLAGKLVNLNKRTSVSLSKFPVNEDDPKRVLSYWKILGALAKISTPDSLNLLLKCTHDVAPDKRELALRSLIEAYQQEEHKEDFGVQINDAIARGLNDLSPQVKIAALEGVSSLRLVNLLPEGVKGLGAKEISVKTKARDVLSNLYFAGYKIEVIKVLEEKRKGELNPIRRSQLDTFVRSLKDQASVG